MTELSDQTWMCTVGAITKAICKRFSYLKKDEIFNAALFAVVKANEGYKPDKNASRATWLRTKGEFLTLDVLRKERRLIRGRQFQVKYPFACARIICETDLQTYDEEDKPIPSPLDTAVARPERNDFKGLGEWVASLTEDEKTFCDLRFVHKQTAKQMAYSLGVSVPTIHYRAKAIIRKLRKKLKNPYI